MKSLYLFFLLICFFSAGVDAANETPAQDPRHSSCVYKYLSCVDACDYHQNRDQVGPCKSQCERTYPCRPKKNTAPFTGGTKDTLY